MRMKFCSVVMWGSLIWALGAAQLENAQMRLTIDETSGAVAVEDRTAGRSWKTLTDERTARTVSVRSLKDAIECSIAVGGVKAIWRLEGAEVCCTLSADVKGTVPKIYYPAPFAAQKGERLLLPHGCGYAFPAEAVDLGGIVRMDEMPFYTRAMKMGCWGHYGEHVAADGTIAQDAGYLAIVETPSDANADFRVRANGCRAVSPVWLPEQTRWGYDRTIRYAFFKTATPIALAQRYRQEMKRRGYLVTYAEKIQRNPKLADAYRQFYGAPDVWYWEIDGDKAKIAAELKQMGFENMLFQYIRRKDLGTWVTPEEVREVAKIPGVLQSEYDIFRDTMEPAMLDKIDAVRPQWPLEAWERDDIVRLSNGEPARGWKVALKSDPTKPVVGCAHLCEAQAPRYVRARVARSLAECPYAARFLDVTGTSVGECYNPKHPLNRRQSEVARRDTFKILGQEFNLLCGAEDGLECYVPHCDYFEGNFSAPFYRVDGGRHMWKTYEKSPEIMARAIDPTSRTPFFEMVFHDCIASYWYWTDYNNRFEDTWWQRDLLNAVSGTPPMYLFTRDVFERQKARLAASVKITTPVARMTANAPMTDWRWLSADRLVQQSRFANGVVSTVNFSDTSRKLPDGRTIPAHGFLFDPPSNKADWIGDLPQAFKSGAAVPSIETTGPKARLVEGDWTRFERVWTKLDRGEPIRIAVIGGSITQGAGATRRENQWGQKFVAGWRRAFPNCTFDFVNAGIGATGSDIGAFRLQRDVIDKKPDVVAVEFAVNDSPNRERAESYEGVIRQLLKAPGNIAVIQIGMVAQGGGNAQEWQKKVAEYYQVPYMSYRDALYFPYVKDGLAKWSDISPDTVHPNDDGHAYAAALLNWTLANHYAAFKAANRAPASLPSFPSAPLFGTRYDSGRFCLMKDAKILENKGFSPLRDNMWGEGLACTNAGDRLVFEVEGATVALLYRLGCKPRNWGKISVKIDGEYVVKNLDCFRDQWWWYTPSLFLCRDKPGRHVVEVEALNEKNEKSNGFGCHLTGILVSEAR